MPPRPKIVQLEEDQAEDDTAEEDQDDIGLRLKNFQVTFHGAEAAAAGGPCVTGDAEQRRLAWNRKNT